jgi:hypothetical protein
MDNAGIREYTEPLERGIKHWQGECRSLYKFILQQDKTIAQLTAENERLQRVVEQACKATDLRLTTIGQMPIGCPDTRHRDADEEVFAGCGALGRTFLAGEITEYPDLYAHLKREDGNGL